MKVVIAGAGIGGLTLALMLHERGIDVEVYAHAELEAISRRYKRLAGFDKDILRAVAT